MNGICKGVTTPQKCDVINHALAQPRDGVVEQKHTCQECGAKWTSRYVYAGIKLNHTTGEKQA